jgi:hypothetical protein
MNDSGKGSGGWKFMLLLSLLLVIEVGIVSFWSSVAGSLLKICLAAW